MITLLTPYQRNKVLEAAFARNDFERDIWEKEHISEWFEDGKFVRVPRIGGGSNQTTIWIEPIWSNKADGPQVVSAAAETALLNATTEQPVFGAMTFFGFPYTQGKTIQIQARGVMQTTGTPTFTFFVRIGTTLNVITGTLILGSAGIVTASGVAAGNLWELDGTIITTTPGIGAAAATLTASGTVFSPAGFASPFMYALWQGGAVTVTWTITLDGSQTQYLMLSMNPGTSSASNNCTLKTGFCWATTH